MDKMNFKEINFILLGLAVLAGLSNGNLIPNGAFRREYVKNVRSTNQKSYLNKDL